MSMLIQLEASVAFVEFSHIPVPLLVTDFFVSVIDSLTVCVSALLCNISPEGIAYGLLISVQRHALKDLYLAVWSSRLSHSLRAH